MTRRVLLLLVACLLLTSGCQRLRFEKSYSLDPLDFKGLDFDPPAYEQRVVVTITPAGGPVSAYLAKTVDKDAVERALDSDKEPPASMLLASRVSKEQPETYALEATVPAKTGYTLMIKAAGKKAEVKVNLIGK